MGLAAQGFAEDVNGAPGEPPPSPESVAPKAVKAAPLAFFKGFGDGTMNITSGSCTNVTCNGGDACNCFQGTIPMAPSGLGKSTLTVSLNNDLDTLGNNGSGGLCRQMSGIGTITKTNGDTVNLVFTGEDCAEAEEPPIQFDGAFSITGGTGALANARGMGSATIRWDTILFGATTGEANLVGAFAKK